MNHDHQAFGHNRAGWYLRAQQQRRREARIAALVTGAGATALAVATGLAMHYGQPGLTVLLGICSGICAIVAAVANSEA